MAVAPHENVVMTNADAAGRINGISHMVLVVRDMDEAVRFYRDLLGLKLISTSGTEQMKIRDSLDAGDARFGGASQKRVFTRQYFMELPNGDGFGFYEIPDSPDGRETAPVNPWYWPGEGIDIPARPHKVDHIAFNVPKKDDVEWFMNRLTAAGVDFKGPFMPREGSPPKYMYRIYFFDPSGNALEIATPYEGDDLPPAGAYFLDTDPVPAALEG